MGEIPAARRLGNHLRRGLPHLKANLVRPGRLPLEATREQTGIVREEPPRGQRHDQRRDDPEHLRLHQLTEFQRGKWNKTNCQCQKGTT